MLRAFFASIAILLGLLGRPAVAQQIFAIQGLPIGWQNLNIGGGGYNTGLEANSDGSIYARTDTAGAYKLNKSTLTWAQMITESSMPVNWFGYYPSPAIFQATVNGAGMNVTSVTDGSLGTGQAISCPGITGSPTITTPLPTAPGGIGNYTLTVSQPNLGSVACNATGALGFTYNGSSGVFELRACQGTNTLYMAYAWTLLKSVDAGAHWTLTNIGTLVPLGTAWANASFRMNGHKMACDPNNPNIVYLGVDNPVGSIALYASYDGGVTFTSIPAGTIPLATAIEGYNIDFDPTSGTTATCPGTATICTKKIYIHPFGAQTYASNDGGLTFAQTDQTHGAGPTSIQRMNVSQCDGAIWAVDGTALGQGSIWSYTPPGYTGTAPAGWSKYSGVTIPANKFSEVVINPTSCASGNIQITANGNGYLDTSINNGASWVGNSTGSSVFINPSDGVGWLSLNQWGSISSGDIIFDPTDNSTGGGLFMSGGAGSFYTNPPLTSSPPVWQSRSAGIEGLVAAVALAAWGVPVVSSEDFNQLQLSSFPSNYPAIGTSLPFSGGYNMDYITSVRNAYVTLNTDEPGNKHNYSGVSLDNGANWTPFNYWNHLVPPAAFSSDSNATNCGGTGGCTQIGIQDGNVTGLASWHTGAGVTRNMFVLVSPKNGFAGKTITNSQQPWRITVMNSGCNGGFAACIDLIGSVFATQNPQNNACPPAGSPISYPGCATYGLANYLVYSQAYPINSYNGEGQITSVLNDNGAVNLTWLAIIILDNNQVSCVSGVAADVDGCYQFSNFTTNGRSSPSTSVTGISGNTLTLSTFPHNAGIVGTTVADFTTPSAVSGATISSFNSGAKQITVNTVGTIIVGDELAIGANSATMVGSIFNPSDVYTGGGFMKALVPAGGAIAAYDTNNIIYVPSNQAFPQCTLNQGVDGWTQLAAPNSPVDGGQTAVITGVSGTTFTFGGGLPSGAVPGLVVGDITPGQSGTLNANAVISSINPGANSFVVNLLGVGSPAIGDTIQFGGFINGTSRPTGWPQANFNLTKVVASDRVQPNLYYLYNYLAGVYQVQNCGAPVQVSTGVGGANQLPSTSASFRMDTIPGENGHIFAGETAIAGSGTGPHPFGSSTAQLYRSCDGGHDWDVIPGFYEVRGLSFGARIGSSTYSAILVLGWYDDPNNHLGVAAWPNAGAARFGWWVLKDDSVNHGIGGYNVSGVHCNVSGVWTPLGGDLHAYRWPQGWGFINISQGGGDLTRPGVWYTPNAGSGFKYGFFP